MNLLSSDEISNFSNSRLSIEKKLYKSITSKSPQYSNVINIDKSNLLSNCGQQFSPESSNVLNLKRDIKNKKIQFENNLNKRHTVGNGGHFHRKMNRARKEDNYKFQRKTFDDFKQEQSELKSRIQNYKKNKNSSHELTRKISDLKNQRKKLIDKLKFCHLNHKENNENFIFNENKKIKSQNFLLKKENNILKEELKDMNLYLNGDTRSIILSNKFDQLNSKIVKHKNNNDFLLKKNIDLLDKLKKSHNVYYDTIEKINKTKIEETEYIKILEKDLEIFKEKNRKLQIKLSSNFSNEEKSKLKKKLKKLENKNFELNILVENLKKNMNKLEKNNIQSSVVSEKMKFLENDFQLMQETFKKNIKGKNKLIKSLKIENTKLTKKLSHLQEYNKNNYLEKNLNDLDNLTFDEQINSYSEKILEYSEKTENYSERINSLQNISSNLQSLQTISKLEKNNYNNLANTRFTAPSLNYEKNFETSRNSDKMQSFEKNKNAFLKYSENPDPVKTEKKNRIFKTTSYGHLSKNRNLKTKNYLTNNKNIHVKRVSLNDGKNKTKFNLKNKKGSFNQWRDRGNNRVVTNNYKKPNEIYLKEVVYLNKDDNAHKYYKHY